MYEVCVIFLAASHYESGCTYSLPRDVLLYHLLLFFSDFDGF